MYMFQFYVNDLLNLYDGSYKIKATWMLIDVIMNIVQSGSVSLFRIIVRCLVGSSFFYCIFNLTRCGI